MVGLVLVKCILDDHPCGHGLVDFVFEYLVHSGAATTLQDPSLSLGALRQFDGELARVWSALLESPASVDGLQLSLESFDPSADGETLVTSDNVGGAVLQGCVARLLSARRASMDALRRGFLYCEALPRPDTGTCIHAHTYAHMHIHAIIGEALPRPDTGTCIHTHTPLIYVCTHAITGEDLEIQLAALGPPKLLALVLQGSQTLSASERLGSRLRTPPRTSCVSQSLCHRRAACWILD